MQLSCIHADVDRDGYGSHGDGWRWGQNCMEMGWDRGSGDSDMVRRDR